MVPRKAAIALLAASLGSCAAPQPTGTLALAGASLTPGPRFVPLAMSADSSPGFSGSCHLDGRLVAFTFRGQSGPNRLCSASCAFLDGNGTVQTAHTGPYGIRPVPALSSSAEFGAVAATGANGPSPAGAVRLVEGSGQANCQILY